MIQKCSAYFIIFIDSHLGRIVDNNAVQKNYIALHVAWWSDVLWWVPSSFSLVMVCIRVSWLLLCFLACYAFDIISCFCIRLLFISCILTQFCISTASYHLIGTVHILCGAGFMKQYSVRPSVCPSMGPQQQTRCYRFAAVGRRCRCIVQQRRANVGSATLSAYVGSWTPDMFSSIIWLHCCGVSISGSVAQARRRALHLHSSPVYGIL